MENKKIFDWGRVSNEYALYRDIYPQEFYDRILKRGLCTNGQKVLDLGTGTGVLPRNMYKYGASWTAADISENQIKQAKRLSDENNMNIEYIVSSAEEIDFADETFDVVTACQCFWYFDYEKALPKIASVLKPDGKLLFLYMAWLPFEDKIAGESERIALKYNPAWSGANETRHPIEVPKAAEGLLEPVYHSEFDLNVRFTRQSWHGRMKACRGVGVSLNPNELADWEREHWEMLEKNAPESFDILHYGAMLEFKLKN